MKRDLNWLKAKADIRIGCFDMVSMGYAIEMYNEDQVHIEKLEKEIASLKEQLEREQGAVDFYASTEAWNRSNCSDVAREMCTDDLDRVKGYAKHCGGKLARATQARREK